MGEGKDMKNEMTEKLEFNQLDAVAGGDSTKIPFIPDVDIDTGDPCPISTPVMVRENVIDTKCPYCSHINQIKGYFGPVVCAKCGKLYNDKINLPKDDRRLD